MLANASILTGRVLRPAFRTHIGADAGRSFEYYAVPVIDPGFAQYDEWPNTRETSRPIGVVSPE